MRFARRTIVKTREFTASAYKNKAKASPFNRIKTRRARERLHEKDIVRTYVQLKCTKEMCLRSRSKSNSSAHTELLYLHLKWISVR